MMNSRFCILHSSFCIGEIMQRRLRIGVLYSRVRVEEKWIFGAMEKRGIDYERLDSRAIFFDLDNPAPWRAFDARERSISYTSGLYALRMLNAFGVPTVNTAAVAKITAINWRLRPCWRAPAIRSRTTWPRSAPRSALEAIETFGYRWFSSRWWVRGAACSPKSTTAMRRSRAGTQGHAGFGTQHSIFYIQGIHRQAGRHPPPL